MSQSSSPSNLEQPAGNPRAPGSETHMEGRTLGDTPSLQLLPDSNADSSECCSQWKRPSHELKWEIKPEKCEAINKCERCRLIARVVNHDDLADRHAWYSGLRPGATLTFEVSLESSAETSYLSISSRKLSFPNLRLYGVEGVPNPWNLKGTPRFVESTGSDSSMAVIRSWLDTCLREHRECPAPVGSKLPTRVLELGDARTAKLIETNDVFGRYVCLSYCWGQRAFVKTTTDNIRPHRSGIDIHTLPRTVQDAIHVCRKLEVRYLWVDALCIIQNDLDDWNKESVRMADIYRNSHFTIAAISSDDVYGGCFNTPKYGVNIGPVVAHEIRHFPNSRNTDRYSEFPLLTRGWVYQERILSPRVLYFGYHELLWDCQYHRTCECGAASYKRDEVSKKNFSSWVNEIVPENDREFPIPLQKLWRQMAIQYSCTHLTRRTDKLSALSGLAEVIQKRTGQNYRAGLWEDTLIIDMCWYTDGDIKPRNGPVERVAWTAPTWSWASIDAAVTYFGQLYSQRSDEYEELRSYATIVESQCTLQVLGSSPTGPIIDGYVELSCTMVRAYIKANKVQAGSFRPVWEMPVWHSDGRVEIEEKGEYYLIPLTTVGGHFNGMIVTPRDGNLGELIRIGFAEVHSNKPWDVPVGDWRTVRIF